MWSATTGAWKTADVLVLSRPDLVREIHRGYYEAGADMVETNTFGASPITLGEFDISDKAYEINKQAGELAREAAESFKDGRQRFVLGSVGPGTRLPTSLGHVAYQPLEDALTVQRGLIAGGVDAILIETCQDPLQIKAAVNGVKVARAEAGTDTPIFVQVTGGDHRHAAGRQRHRGGGHRDPRARRAADRPQLRHRPGRNVRACQMAGGELAGPDLRPAQRRPARTGRWPDPLSLCWPTSSRTGWSASCATMA